MTQARRQFLTQSLKTGAAVGLGALALGLYNRQSKALPANTLRPPGASGEDDFPGACIRCGLCVRACPFDTLTLARTGEPVAQGTPYFIARQIPCEMCDDIPCVKACPTGALDQELVDISEARMGLAVVIDQEGCIAFNGLRCEVCFNVCPLRSEAITLDRQHNERTGKHAYFIPTVHSDACTGCGKCEHACIVDGEAAIKVVPVHLAKSGGSGHYRFGWEEQTREGEALVTPDIEHQYNLPDGVRYDHAGEGLIFDDPAMAEPAGSGESAVPFSSDPLDTLNRKTRP